MEFQDLLLSARQLSDYSQQQIAQKLNYSVQVVSKWENGVSSPSLDILVQMCNLYKIDLESFFTGNLIAKDEPYAKAFNLDDFVNRFKIVRQNLHLSHAQIANALNKSKSFMIRLEKGNVMPKASFYIEYVNLYKLNPIDTYFGTPFDNNVHPKTKNKKGLLIALIALTSALALSVVVTSMYMISKSNSGNEGDNTEEIVDFDPSKYNIPDNLNNFTLSSSNALAIRNIYPSESKNYIHSLTDYLSFLFINNYYFKDTKEYELTNYPEETWLYGKSYGRVFQDNYGSSMDYANLTKYFLSDCYDEVGFLNLIYAVDYGVNTTINYVKTNDTYYFFNISEIIGNSWTANSFNISETKSLEEYTKAITENNSYINFVIEGEYSDGYNLPFSFLNDYQDDVFVPTGSDYNILYIDSLGISNHLVEKEFPVKLNRDGISYESRDINNVMDFNNGFDNELGKAKLTNSDFSSIEKDLNIKNASDKINTLKDVLNFLYYRNTRSITEFSLYFKNNTRFDFNYSAESVYKSNIASPASLANFANYLLSGDYDEVGYITHVFSNLNSYSYTTNYIKENGVYYFYDLYTWVNGYSDITFIASNFDSIQEYCDSRWFMNSKDIKIVLQYVNGNDLIYTLSKFTDKKYLYDSSTHCTIYNLSDDYLAESIDISQKTRDEIEFRRRINFD